MTDTNKELEWKTRKVFNGEFEKLIKELNELIAS